MDTAGFCQSCGLPLDNPALQGTEKGGALNNDYCRYCYHEGTMRNPAMPLADMQEHVKKIMAGNNAPLAIIEETVARLPWLKRWRKKKIAVKKQNNSSNELNPEEKHPLERPPASGPLATSAEELDRVQDEDEEEIPDFSAPEPGEGP